MCNSQLSVKFTTEDLRFSLHNRSYDPEKNFEVV